MAESHARTDAHPAAPRRARPEDASALAALKHLTFTQTFLEGFAIPYPAADIAQFVKQTYAPERVHAEIMAPDHGTWVCEGAGGALRAYAHAGPCKLPHPDADPGQGELYQIYVERSAQGLGLGKQLLNAALGWLEEQFPGPIWLGVWSGNLPAQAFYAAAGFHKVGCYHFMVGSHRDDEFILRRE